MNSSEIISKFIKEKLTMDKKRKIFAISGSTRKNSSNENILKTISELFKEELEVEIFNQIDTIPHFNPDLDNDGAPQSIKNFRLKIENSDGVIICSPEYVFSLPGSLKNAIEWTVSTTVFSYKPFAFIIASGLGEKAFESLNLIMSTLLQTKVPENCKLLIKGGRSKINEQGRITDENILNEIKGVINSLIQQIETARGLGQENNK
jgi:chromate reductase